MNEDYILLKFISSADKCNRKKYLKDFLNGSLYMNTLNYFWNEYYRDSQNKKQEEGGNVIDTSNWILPEGQKDVFEGVIGTIKGNKFSNDNDLQKALMSDLYLRAKGFGYCNTLCFYKLKYQYFTRFGEKCVAYNINTNMKLFGDYVIIIDNQLKLLERIRKAVEKEKYKFLCGPVKYRIPKLDGKHARKGNSVILKANEEFQLTKYANYISSEKNCFDKMDKFSYQNEWRIVLYRGAKTYEPYRLEIGNIRDICHWVKAEDLDTELRIYFHNNKIKSPYLVEYGNCTKDELRNLFCKLGNDRVEVLAVIG